MSIEEARVKPREPWVAYENDPATPQPASKQGGEVSVDQLADNAWYAGAYGRDEDGGTTEIRVAMAIELLAFSFAHLLYYSLCWHL